MHVDKLPPKSASLLQTVPPPPPYSLCDCMEKFLRERRELACPLPCVTLSSYLRVLMFFFN